MVAVVVWLLKAVSFSIGIRYIDKPPVQGRPEIAMQLISLPVSPFAARVRIAVYAKGLEVEIAPPPAGWPRNPQFRDLNPTGRVPVLLLEDGRALWESAVILEFLEERFPGSRPLLPADLHARARARLLVRHADLYLTPPMAVLAAPRTPEGEGRRQMEALLDALGILDGLLEEGPYAVGEGLSFADCALAPVLFAARVTEERAGLSMMDAMPRIAAYARRVRADPHVDRVIGEMEEGLRAIESGVRPAR
jgi:glutathione S-transferase